MLGTVIMPSIIPGTLFEQLINLLKAKEMFIFFLLNIAKKANFVVFYCRCREVRLTMLGVITENAPRTLKRRTRQEKMPHLYQEKS